MTKQIERITLAIENTKAKIAELQEKLRDLEEQKTKLVGAEVIALFQKEKLTENDIADFLRLKNSEQDSAKEESTLAE